MLANRSIGWFALALFVVAAAVLATAIIVTGSPARELYDALDPQIMLRIGAIFALGSAVLGSFGYQTTPGKVGAVCGLVLLITVIIFLAINQGEGIGAQLQPIVMEVSPR